MSGNSSPSITLRPFRLTDAPDMMLWAGDDQVTRTLRWKTLTSIEEALTFIEEVCIPHPWRRSICIDDRSIGFVSIFQGSGEDGRKVDIGYAIAAKYWGQGIATKAVKIALPRVFDDLPHVVRLQAFVYVDNLASQRVLEKIGFMKEGLLRKYAYIKGNVRDLLVYKVVSLHFVKDSSAKKSQAGEYFIPNNKTTTLSASFGSTPMFLHHHNLAKMSGNSSPSITLRPFRLTDAPDMMLWAGDDQVTRTLRWKTLTSIEEALTFIEEVCIPHPWRRSICIDDRSIGFMSIFQGSGEDGRKAEIGYAIAAKYWGQGIATKAVKIALPRVFDDLPDVARLQAFVYVDNLASQRVLEKIGFMKEGLLRKYAYIKGNIRDLLVYSILSTDAVPGTS
ncbi:hypothetical protein RJ640_013325 [Escallonia rubra]|uniref:N-acetyltransferase domain-containing protein n=1 Tax=Escallonia rubra TaxID=112253 RepID=A0AA88R8T6_9ASTE|nr:hypothetical protein RJ640_013325 [Escallonia rubra]